MPPKTQQATSPSVTDTSRAVRKRMIQVVLLFLIQAVILVMRTAREDRTLRDELPGYDAYTQETRYRLLPGIW